MPQSSTRGLRNFDTAAAKYPAEVYNINNAARNLVEIIANAARNDTGDYRIRIYTIGMGQLVPLLLGTRPETSESILKRIANDSSVARTSTATSSKASTSTRRQPPTWARRSRPAEPDSSVDQVTRHTNRS